MRRASIITIMGMIMRRASIITIMGMIMRRASIITIMGMTMRRNTIIMTGSAAVAAMITTITIMRMRFLPAGG